MRAFLIHGLNNNHASLLDVATIFQSMGVSPEIIPLSGHWLHQKSNLDKCNWSDWEGDFQNLAKKIQSQNELVLLFGFSLGALVIAKCLQELPEIQSKIQKLIYFSPAFARRSYTSSAGFLQQIWPNGAIPSTTPKLWRQHPYCTFSAYQALNFGYKAFHQTLVELKTQDHISLKNMNNIPTHIVIDPRDICVSTNMILDIKKNFYFNWHFHRFNLKMTKSFPSFHTTFDRTCFNAEEWNHLWPKILL